MEEICFGVTITSISLLECVTRIRKCVNSRSTFILSV